jgi:photosystem II stability/assembly factor-like uncharacterized protein
LIAVILGEATWFSIGTDQVEGYPTLTFTQLPREQKGGSSQVITGRDALQHLKNEAYLMISALMNDVTSGRYTDIASAAKGEALGYETGLKYIKQGLNAMQNVQVRIALDALHYADAHGSNPGANFWRGVAQDKMPGGQRAFRQGDFRWAINRMEDTEVIHMGILTRPCASLVIVCVCLSACKSYLGSPSTQLKADSPSAAPFVVNDSDWDLKLINEFASGHGPHRIQCNGQRLCWAWNSRSIWISDGMDQWHQLYQLPQHGQDLDGIESVFMLSSSMGWFITPSVIYQTADGGKNWTPSTDAPSNGRGNFHSVFFRDEKYGWIAGGEFRPRLTSESLVNNAISQNGKDILVASIWETSDGGSTWKAKNIKRLIGRFKQIEFWGRIGLAFGDAGAVLTRDGGDKWETLETAIPRQLDTGTKAEITSADFPSSDEGWIFTSWFENISTHNGGKSWSIVHSHISNPTGNPEEIIPLAGAFVESEHGLVIARDSHGGMLLKTSDGGQNWVVLTTVDQFQDLRLIGRNGLIVGGRGIYKVSKKNKS